MCSTPTTEDNLEAVQLKRPYRHHLLEVMLNVVKKVVFVFEAITIRAKTPRVISVGGRARPAQFRIVLALAIAKHSIDELRFDSEPLDRVEEDGT